MIINMHCRLLLSAAGLFEKSYIGARAAMEEAVSAVNNRRDILRDVKLVAEVDTVPAQDSFAAAKVGKQTLGVVENWILFSVCFGKGRIVLDF